MSTRASIIIRDCNQTIFLYRHSDGYPGATGESLKTFVKGYQDGSMRTDAQQSAGWLILQGHLEYNESASLALKPNPKDSYGGWKVGAYEPSDSLHGDVEYIYVIDLEAKTLTCRTPKSGFWDKPTIANTKPLRGFSEAFGAA